MSDLGGGAPRLLVAGSTGGIGSAVAEEAERGGCEVVRFDRADFATLAERGLPDGPSFQAAVFAVGACAVRPFLQTTEADFAEAFAVNCLLFLRLVRALVKSRRLGRNSRLVAISSVSATEGWAGGTAYCAAKGALSAACRALDVELAPRGIAVVALEPRWIRTRMFEETAGRMGVDPARAQRPEDFAREVLGTAFGAWPAKT